MLIITSDGESKHNRGRNQDLKKNRGRKKRKEKDLVWRNNDIAHMGSHVIQEEKLKIVNWDLQI